MLHNVSFRWYYASLILGAFLAFASVQAWSEYSEDVEKRAQELEKQLVAPCCWGGTLDGHSSKMAEDMKAEIRRNLAAGQTEEQIMTAYVAKYTERVRAAPQAKGLGVLLWVLPPFALLAASILVIFLLRKWVQSSPPKEGTSAGSEVQAPAIDPKEREILERVERELAAR